MELTASEGESVAILQETHGWYWCTNAEGVSGWIPAENVGVVE
jgi:SH3-like domain-containing protein